MSTPLPTTNSGKSPDSTGHELHLWMKLNGSSRGKFFAWKSLTTKNPNSSGGTGFYKRLIEWVNQKKKTRRRHSDVPLPSGSAVLRSDPCSLQVNIPTVRNKSAPMIFDIPFSKPVEQPRNSGSQHETRAEMLQQLSERQSSEEKEQENDHEWNIPWDDLHFGSPVVCGKSCTISKGQWHGEVIIHEFKLGSSREVNLFWSEVNSLSKLRHENLLLFMGVAVKSPSHAVISSAPRGLSLTKFRDERKNGQSDKLSLRAGISIGRQVGQAMGYLHARGLFHGKINTDNIFLEGENYRAKLSLLDHGIVNTTFLRDNCGCLLRSHVGYLSPEQVRCLLVDPPFVRFSTTVTKFVDVYSFGSLLFDLIVGRAPFWNDPVHSALWRIGSGDTANLQNITCSMKLKALIAACWSYDPAKRPDFVEIVQRLQPTALLCKSHSCSEPERLNRVGTCKLAC